MQYVDAVTEHILAESLQELVPINYNRMVKGRQSTLVQIFLQSGGSHAHILTKKKKKKIKLLHKISAYYIMKTCIHRTDKS